MGLAWSYCSCILPHFISWLCSCCTWLNSGVGKERAALWHDPLNPKKKKKGKLVQYCSFSECKLTPALFSILLKWGSLSSTYFGIDTPLWLGDILVFCLVIWGWCDIYCVQGLLCAGIWGPHREPGIGHGLAACRASTFPAVLCLCPDTLFFF